MASIPCRDGGVFCGGEDILDHFFCDFGFVVEFFEFHCVFFFLVFGAMGVSIVQLKLAYVFVDK